MLTNSNDKRTESTSLSFSFDVNTNNINKEEYLSSIRSKLQFILDNRFQQSYEKRQIHLAHNRISFACPYCGDSMKSQHKKRGSIILTGKFQNYFKCHNCGEFKRIDKFFSDFNKELEYNEIDFLISNIQDFGYFSNYNYDISLFLDIDQIEKYSIKREDIKKSFNLVEISNSKIEPYLKNRLQYDYNKFLYDSKNEMLLILNITPAKNVLSFQIRKFKKDNRFETYTIDKLYKLFKKEEVLTQEIISISHIYNICLIDHSKPITLFEGPMDSFLFKNSIANGGANKSFPFEIPIRYFYDYDKTGIKKSIEKIEQGNQVFLWSKYIKENSLPNRKKWDLNDLKIYNYQNKIKNVNLEQYFSDNIYDIIDI